MPNDTIKRAVKRGTGEIEGAAYEEIALRGHGPRRHALPRRGDDRQPQPHRRRDPQDLREAQRRARRRRHGGWAFERKGVIALAKDAATEDQLMDVAVGAGAEDYTDAGEEWHLTTPPDALNVVLEALEKAGIKVEVEQRSRPCRRSKKPLAGRDAEVALNLAEALDDHDDVQNVYADFDISDEELATLEGASVSRHDGRPRARSRARATSAGASSSGAARGSSTSPTASSTPTRRRAIAVRLVDHRARARRGAAPARARRRERRGALLREGRAGRGEARPRARRRAARVRARGPRGRRVPPGAREARRRGHGTRRQGAGRPDDARRARVSQVAPAADAADALALAVTHLQHVRHDPRACNTSAR